MRLVTLSSQEYECDGYREIIRPYVPTLLRIIAANSNEDKAIQERFLKWLLIVSNVVKTSGIFQLGLKEATFFDVFLDAKDNNNESAIDLLKFIDNCIEEILSKTTGQNNKIKTIIIDMIINFDEKESRFYSKVSELACLRKFLQSTEFKIIDIEKKLSNGKSVDIVINFNGEDIFCEVFSMFLRVEKINSNDDIYNFLYRRAAQKFGEKFRGVSDDDLKKSAIIPVIWCDNLTHLKQYREPLERFISEYRNQVFPPYGLVYIKEKKKYYFETVSSFFQKMW